MKWKRWPLRIGLGAGLVAAVGLLALAVLHRKFVVAEPGAHLAESAIRARISQESPVYSRDGAHRIGVFFQGEHRRYVPYGDIPRACVDAIVASEDKRFWRHPGVDPFGVARAMLSNLAAGEVVAGGSTLTQQTAKNIFDRRDRSFREKGRELVNALRLEAKYPKEKILEFYLNQFYVNGNGRGLGIAARYFFDKEVPALTTLECAFLAGSVRSPNHYNPFFGETAAARARALERAKVRTRYVLGRMREDGLLSEAEHAALAGAEIPWKQGRFRYRESVVLDQVSRELDRLEVRAALQAHGIDNPAQGGLSIITTIDREMQEGAVYALRHHLTEVGVLLEGPSAEGLLVEGDEPEAVRDGDVRPGTFFAGRLAGVDADAKEVRVDLGGVVGVVDGEGLTRLARLLVRGKKGVTWGEPAKKDVEALLGVLAAAPPARSGVLVSVREAGEDGEPPRLDLEYPTELQGAVLVLDGARVRAMVGGSDNRHFNRAFQARRQFGSTFKPIVMAAALQLGWSLTDELDNRRQVFPFQGQFYWPRPDHRGAPDHVSLAWAGVTSENLASVSLLYHLTDPLTPAQLRETAGRVGMAPAPGEGREAYVERVRDRMGIVPSRERVREGLFEEARAALAAEKEAAGDAEGRRVLGAMSYGTGFDAERARAVKETGGEERAARRAVLARSYLRQQELAATWEEDRDAVLAWLRDPGARTPEALGRLCALPAASGAARRLSYGDWRPAGCVPATREALVPAVGGVSMPPSAGTLAGGDGTEPGPATESGPAVGPAPATGASVWGPTLDGGSVVLEGQLTAEDVRRLQTAIATAEAALDPSDPFAWDNLRRVRDFRTMVGIRYVAEFARAAGVEAPLAPVPSLPLGSSDVSLLDIALVYDAMLDGRVTRFDQGTRRYGLLAEVCKALPLDTTRAEEEDLGTAFCRTPGHEDEILVYRPTGRDAELMPPGTAAEVAQILRNVVAHGTARRAEGVVRVDGERGLPVPLFGKTGTTNSYTNAAFVGWVPRVAGGEAADLPAGCTVAAYVGYDDNRKMARQGVRIAGATGSLPAWVLAARAVVAGQAAEAGLREVPPDPEPATEVAGPYPPPVAPVALAEVPFGPEPAPAGEGGTGEAPAGESEGTGAAGFPGAGGQDAAAQGGAGGTLAAGGPGPAGGGPGGVEWGIPGRDGEGPAAPGSETGQAARSGDVQAAGGMGPSRTDGEAPGAGGDAGPDRGADGDTAPETAVPSQPVDPTAGPLALRPVPDGPMTGPALVAVPGAGLPVLYPPGLAPVRVDPGSGLPSEDGGVVLLTDGVPREKRFRLFTTPPGP